MFEHFTSNRYIKINREIDDTLHAQCTNLSTTQENLAWISTDTKKKWVLEIEPRILEEAFLAINSRFSIPEFAVEMGMPLKELTVQPAKLLIYPYL